MHTSGDLFKYLADACGSLQKTGRANNGLMELFPLFLHIKTVTIVKWRNQSTVHGTVVTTASISIIINNGNN